MRGTLRERATTMGEVVKAGDEAATSVATLALVSVTITPLSVALKCVIYIHNCASDSYKSGQDVSSE